MSSVRVVFGMFVKATEENRKRTLDEWAQLAKIKEPGRIPETTWHSGFNRGGVVLDNLYGKWTVADIPCQCCLEDYGNYLCFEIFANWRSVSDYGLPERGEVSAEVHAEIEEDSFFYKDPRVKIAEDFAQACVAVGAEVGIYTNTLLYKPSYREMQEWLKEEVYEQAIRTQDARALFLSHWNVLYLNEAWHKELHRAYPKASVAEQLFIVDPPPGPHGVLLFRERGRLRF